MTCVDIIYVYVARGKACTICFNVDYGISECGTFRYREACVLWTVTFKAISRLVAKPLKRQSGAGKDCSVQPV